MMDTPDFADLGAHSVWSEETWRDAWEIVTGYFTPNQVSNVWTAIRNSSMGPSDWTTSPRVIAAALVRISEAD